MAAERLFEMRFAARPERLRLLRCTLRDAASAAGLSGEETERVVLAANEACMNIIQHAYGSRGDGEVVVEVIDNGEDLELRFIDFAAPVDASTCRPRDLEDVRPGGLGTHFMREAMDEVRYSRLDADGCNCLVMKKYKNK